MTADPRGRWFRVYARQVRQHPKFRDLNVTQLGAWLTLRAEAELRDSACFADRAEAILVLRRRGTPRPAAMLDGLVALVLFDVEEDGRVTVHDRADHDRPNYPSDDPERVRERKREQRSRESHESVTSRDGESHDTRARVQPQPTANSQQPQPPELRVVGEDELSRDGADAYYEVTARFPSDNVLRWINRLSKKYTDALFGNVLSKVYLEDDDPRTLLSRTEERLKSIYFRQHRAEIQASQRAAEQAALDDVKRQHAMEWEPCGRCGVRRGAHRADHEWEPAA